MSNDGVVNSGKIGVPYGKDSSEFSGPASAERINESLGGSVTNLKHTLRGAEAMQRMGGSEG